MALWKLWICNKRTRYKYTRMHSKGYLFVFSPYVHAHRLWILLAEHAVNFRKMWETNYPWPKLLCKRAGRNWRRLQLRSSFFLCNQRFWTHPKQEKEFKTSVRARIHCSKGAFASTQVRVLQRKHIYLLACELPQSILPFLSYFWSSLSRSLRTFALSGNITGFPGTV